MESALRLLLLLGAVADASSLTSDQGKISGDFYGDYFCRPSPWLR